MYTAVNIILDTRLKTEQILKFHIEKIESNFSVISGKKISFICQQYFMTPERILYHWKNYSGKLCAKSVCLSPTPYCVGDCPRPTPIKMSEPACDKAPLRVSKCVNQPLTPPNQNGHVRLPPLPPVSMCRPASHPCRLSQLVCPPPIPVQT